MFSVKRVPFTSYSMVTVFGRKYCSFQHVSKLLSIKFHVVQINDIFTTLQFPEAHNYINLLCERDSMYFNCHNQFYLAVLSL